MPYAKDLLTLPDNLPVPVDDGACDHLIGSAVPSVSLLSTAGTVVDLSQRSGRTVLYIYPRTGDPKGPSVAGWEDIPGARGCTPQTCSFRDHYQEIKDLQADVFGLSVQPTDVQQEMAERLHVPFAVLSDSDLALTKALKLPTFVVQFDGRPTALIKRLTLIIKDGVIEHVFYPVFPPDQNPDDVIAWLKKNA